MGYDARWGADNGYPGSPAEVAGGGGVAPGVCPERTDRAKKSLKIAVPRHRQR